VPGDDDLATQQTRAASRTVANASQQVVQRALQLGDESCSAVLSCSVRLARSSGSGQSCSPLEAVDFGVLSAGALGDRLANLAVCALQRGVPMSLRRTSCS